jgi:TonB-dependent receptor
LNNPANQVFEGLYEEAQVSEGEDYQARIDSEYELDLSFLRSVELGARYSSRNAHREFGNRFGGFARERRFPISVLPLDFTVPRGGFRGTDVQSGTRTFLTPTYSSIRNRIRDLRQFVITNKPDFGFPNEGRAFTLDAPVPNPNSVFDADEETLAGYVQANYRIGEQIDGVIGVRAVRTETQIDGVALLAGVPKPISAGSEYTDYLPTANLRWRFTPQLQARLSYTQTRTRPTFRQLNPSADLGAPDPTQGGLRTGRGGNPNLRPVDSNNYDASLEYFFSRTGFASLAVFRRDVRGFIQDQTLPDVQDPVLGLIRITGPVNTRRGRIEGLETQVSTFFDFEGIPNFLRNFGIQANYTYLNGKVDILNPLTNTFVRDRITSPEGEGDYGGVSKHTYNVAAMYEGGPLSARLTYNKRSHYLDRRDLRGDEQGGFYREEAYPAGRLDFSANYTLGENLTFFFDATNLTGNGFRVDFSSARNGAPRTDYVRYLRYDEQTFSLGVRFRL